MRIRTALKWVALAAGLVAGGLAGAQEQMRGLMTMGFSDLAAIKAKAEAGDAAAQVALADSLSSHWRSAEALGWYRKAAAQGNVEAEYHVGALLLHGWAGIPETQAVRSNPEEALRWTFMAATNRHAGACHNMARALRDGIGTGTELIEAYAWLKLYSETLEGSTLGRVEMNELALKMDTGSLQVAQGMAAQFKAGDWQAALARAARDDESRFKLGGITMGGNRSVAIINGHTFWEGHSAPIKLKTGTVKLTCLKIERDSVLVSVEGEEKPRTLRVK